MEENIEIHRSETVGRYVRAKRILARNSLISSCQSFQIAAATALVCHWCGRKFATFENDQREACHQCQIANFCSNCLVGQHCHVESGECVLLSTYASLNDHTLPIQGLLAYRLLTNLTKENELINSLDDLVGSRDDCDEGRLAIVQSLKVAYRTCFPEKEFQEIRFLDILGKIRRNGFKFGTGITLFSTSSLFNHSCAPNAVLTVEYSETHPSRLLACVRAIRDIEINEEINISYHPLGLLPTHIRREVLMEKHEFVCQCPSCTDYCGQCDALLLGVEPSEEQEEQKGEGVEDQDLNPALLQLETLTDILNEMDTEMNQAIGAANGNPDLIASILDPIVENHSSIFKYLASIQHLNPSHYLLFQYDVLLSEIALACHHLDDLGHHTSEWLERLENLPELLNLCDVHLYCRMAVLQAESCYDRFLSSNRLYHTLGFKERTLRVLARAIAISTSIYSESYQLVTLLQEKMTTVQAQDIALSPPVAPPAPAVTFREIYLDSGSDISHHFAKNPLMIRLVGFSQRIDFISDHTLRAANKLLEHVDKFLVENLSSPSSACHSQPTPCLVWDGDVYSQDSFTFLIPELTSRLLPNGQLFCFIQSPQDLERFKSHWSSSLPLSSSPSSLRLEITLLIYSADQGWNSSNYDHYAVQNHKHQSPRIVFCFGGGQTVLFEYEACHNSNSSNLHHQQQQEQDPGNGDVDGGSDVFYFYDIHRRNLISGDIEQSALLPYLVPKG